MPDIAIERATTLKTGLGESPFWDARAQRLWWVDIPAGLIHCLDPASGTEDSASFGEAVGCLAPVDDETLIVAARSGIYLFHWPSRTKRLFSDVEADQPTNRFNDGATDPAGRFWCGSMGQDPSLPQGSFYRVGTEGDIFAWRDGIFTTNGLAFSPDGATMYFSDSNPKVRTLWQCPYDLETGTPGEPRVFLDTSPLPGRPDGGTVDAEGHYWMAGIGGWQLYRLAPDGALVQTLDLPLEKPTKAVFGGPEMDTLFVTSFGDDLTQGTENRQPHAGHVIAITGLGVKGAPQARAKVPLTTLSGAQS